MCFYQVLSKSVHPEEGQPGTGRRAGYPELAAASGREGAESPALLTPSSQILTCEVWKKTH